MRSGLAQPTAKSRGWSAKTQPFTHHLMVVHDENPDHIVTRNRFWIGGAAYDAFRSIIYFGGQGVGTDALKLLAWLGVGVVMLAALPVWRKIGPGRGRHASA